MCAKYHIVDKIQLNTEVAELRYLREEELWEVRLQHLVRPIFLCHSSSVSKTSQDDIVDMRPRLGSREW